MKRTISSLIIVASLFAFGVSGFAQQLNEKTQQAMLDALNDEYKAEALYQKVIKKFGDVRPFANIVKAEQTHISELLPLFEKYGVDVPENEWAEKVPEYASLEEACKAGVEAEIENAKMYDEFFTFVQEEDIIEVFTRLRDASQEKHLPAFERCAERGESRGQGQGNNGQGKGRDKGNGNGQGKNKN